MSSMGRTLVSGTAVRSISASCTTFIQRRPSAYGQHALKTHRALVALLPAALRPEPPELVRSASASPEADAERMLSPPSGFTLSADGPVPSRQGLMATAHLPGGRYQTVLRAHQPERILVVGCLGIYTLFVRDAVGILAREQ